MMELRQLHPNMIDYSHWSQNPKNLVGWWRLDQTAWNGINNDVYDLSTHNNHGKAYNGATTVISQRGRVGSFDGSNDYVSTNLADFYPISSCSWVKWVSDGTNNDHAIGTWNGNKNGWGFKIYPANNIRVFAYKADRTTLDTAILPNVWTQVCLTFDGSNLKLYVNGVIKGTVSGITPTVGGNIYIGNIPSLTLNNGFSGLIDDVRIYNIALTESQVKWLYVNDVALRGGLIVAQNKIPVFQHHRQQQGIR